MNSFNVDVGVTCIYCHQKEALKIPGQDFANDDIPAKNIAREMLKMTLKLNRKYFGIKANSETTVPVKRSHYFFFRVPFDSRV